MSAVGEEAGGTKLQKRKMEQQMAAHHQQQQQQQQQQMPPQQQQQLSPQQQQQMMYQQQMAAAQQQQQKKVTFEECPVDKVKIPRKKSFFGSMSDDSLKYSILVAIIFLVFNSKLVWKQLCKLPFMGCVDPSIIALVVNSLLAAIVFYIVSKYFMK